MSFKCIQMLCRLVVNYEEGVLEDESNKWNFTATGYAGIWLKLCIRTILFSLMMYTYIINPGLIKSGLLDCF